MKLSELPDGTKLKVVGFQHGLPRAHLLSMGLTPGVTFELLGRAPLGDPMVLRVRDIPLSVRAKDMGALAWEPV